MIKKIKIDFCIVGPQRTGSTWLYEVFNRYNLACLPKDVKETNYFDNNYSKGNSYYSNFFRCNTKGKLRGEIATTYFDNLESINRIKEHNPDCKIIVIYRNPVERAVSLYNHHKKRRSVSDSIIDAVNDFPSIKEGGKYSKWLPLWKEQFGTDRVKVLNYHQLQSNPQAYIDELLSFLGVESIQLQDQDKAIVNKSSNPKYLLLARYSAACVRFLRGKGLNKIIRAGKKMGLNKVYSGNEVDDIGSEERLELTSFFVAEDYIYE